MTVERKEAEGGDGAASELRMEKQTMGALVLASSIETRPRTEGAVELDEVSVGQHHRASPDIDDRAQLAGELQHRALHDGAADPGDEAGWVKGEKKFE